MKTEGESGFRKETALPTRQEKAETARFLLIQAVFTSRVPRLSTRKGGSVNEPGRKGRGDPEQVNHPQ